MEHNVWGALPDEVSSFVVNLASANEGDPTDTFDEVHKAIAVAEMVPVIAHDFNNNLQTIASAIELVRGRLARQQVDEVPLLLQHALESVFRASTLSRQLMDYTRPNEPTVSPAALNSIVASMRPLMSSIAGGSTVVRLSLGTDVQPLSCSADGLENVLLNLVINARDAMPSGGTVTIKTCAAHLPSALPLLRAGHYAGLFVTDTGVGMSSDVLAHAFEPYFTTKPKGLGTGLGLASIRAFARRNRGHVEAVSRPGEGTTMRVFLPCF